MVKLLRWTGAALFLLLPAICIYGVWVADIRFLFIFGIVAVFSVLFSGFADAIKKADDGGETLF